MSEVEILGGIGGSGPTKVSIVDFLSKSYAFGVGIIREKSRAVRIMYLFLIFGGLGQNRLCNLVVLFCRLVCEGL